MMKWHFLSLACLFVFTAQAQNNKGITVSGSIQSDILIPQDDEKIGTEKTSDDVQTNTYAEVNLMSEHVDAGVRFEYLEHPMPGFEKDFKGWGVPHFFVKGKLENAELTVGHFYDQFGSGFIFRTYEERSIGVDNALLGGHLVYKPFKGVQLKALTGKQRRYWKYNDSWISGGDVELNLDQWFRKMAESETYLTLGFSFVNKHERADNDEVFVDAHRKLNLPENVNAWDVRANFSKGGFSLLAEYAQKSQDPSFDNNYIYRKGYVAMLSASYSKKGLSALLQAKRSDNMSFRSRRKVDFTASAINHLPAFTYEHTYTLAAQYPYATNPGGEWAYQAELGYTFKRNTLLGGKYGTSVKLNYSYVHGIEKTPKSTKVGENEWISERGSDGYSSAFWKWGDQTYYQDMNIQIDKRFTKDFKINLMYMNQLYNKTIVEGEGGLIHADIFVADAKYRINKKMTLRGEAQYLSTKDDDGDSVFGLLELSVLPHFMFTISDEWNCGGTKIHYYMGSVTYNVGSHRLQVGYGRTSDGYNCSGGVCRYVPASKGLSISYNYNF